MTVNIVVSLCFVSAWLYYIYVAITKDFTLISLSINQTTIAEQTQEPKLYVYVYVSA